MTAPLVIPTGAMRIASRSGGILFRTGGITVVGLMPDENRQNGIAHEPDFSTSLRFARNDSVTLRYA